MNSEQRLEMRKINVCGSCLDAFTWMKTYDTTGMYLHGRKLWKDKERTDELEISIIALKHLIPEAP